MKIMFLSHYFPPEVNAPATRTYEHCKVWVEQGHEVTVVTCAPNHPKGKVYSGYKNHFYQKDMKAGICVIRLWTLLAANAGFLKRILNYLSYLLAVIIAAPVLPRTDVVISTSPQFFCGLAGYFLSRIKRIPWVLEIRDLWPESILAVGATQNQFIIRCLRWLELFAYRKADRIVSVTDSFKTYMVERGIEASKIEVIKNGVDLTLYKQMPVDLTYKQALGFARGDVIVAYVGTHGMAHNLETVLYAADQLREHTCIKFLLVGGGAYREALLQQRTQLNLDNVVMLDQQPKETILKIWALTDISLALLKKSDLFKTVIPSKLFEGMAMHKPILLGVEGESLRMIECAQAGIGFEPDNATALAQAVLRLVEDPCLMADLGQHGRNYVKAQHNRTDLAKRYLSLLHNCLAVKLPLKKESLL